MAVIPHMHWLLLIAMVMTSRVVFTAPTGDQQLSEAISEDTAVANDNEVENEETPELLPVEDKVSIESKEVISPSAEEEVMKEDITDDVIGDTNDVIDTTSTFGEVGDDRQVTDDEPNEYTWQSLLDWWLEEGEYASDFPDYESDENTPLPEDGNQLGPYRFGETQDDIGDYENALNLLEGFSEGNEIDPEIIDELLGLFELYTAESTESVEEAHLATADEKPNSGDSEETPNSNSTNEGSKHRIKRDLSWDALDAGKDARSYDELNPQQRFERLLGLFKGDERTAEREEPPEEAQEVFYLGFPDPLQAAAAVHQEEELQDGEEIPGGAFINDENEEEAEGEEADETGNWGAYLAPGSPYREDGYAKRDDENEALKVYIESLQNLEGYRKRASQRQEFLDIDPRSTNLLREFDQRSPSDESRYPKSGQEPFSREKYFPFLTGPEGMSDDNRLSKESAAAAVIKYNNILELLNTQLEEINLILDIEEMAGELGREQQILDSLVQEEAAEEVQLEDELEADEANRRPEVKRSSRQRLVDYPDFNDLPLEFPGAFGVLPDDDDDDNDDNDDNQVDMTDEELMLLYNRYLTEKDEEEKWGDYLYQPRDRRGDEDELTGPHGGYYVQGRLIGKLMNPKRTVNPYVLVDPADLGYDEWPGEFDIYYNTRDGTYIMYPYEAPRGKTADESDEDLLDGLMLSARNFHQANDVRNGGNEGWEDFRDEDDILQEDLDELNVGVSTLEYLRLLREYDEQLAAEEEMEAENERANEEEFLRELVLG